MKICCKIIDSVSKQCEITLFRLSVTIITEIVGKYKNDERIIIWDVYNEPVNSKRDSVTVAHLKRFFEIIRGIDPIQPIAVGIWSQFTNLEKLKESEKYGLENSDIISYRNYNL